jgi:hypothetical protein
VSTASRPIAGEASHRRDVEAPAME